MDRPVVTDRKSRGRKKLQQLAEVVAELRREAKEKGLDKMSKRKINAAVDAARSDLKKSRKRSATPERRSVGN